MKWLFTFFLFTCAGFLSAQVNYHIDYLFSGRIENKHSQINNQLGGGLSIKNVHIKMLGGVEKWYVKPSSVSYNQVHNNYYNHYTLKTDLLIGYVSNISTTPLKVGILYGCRLYFNNQVQDSVTLYYSSSNSIFSKGYQMSSISRSTLAKFSPFENSNSVNGILYHQLSDYSILTKMPFAHVLNVSLGYSFKQFTLNTYYTPYLIRFHYQNARYAEQTGKNYLLFHDVGVGLSYTFSSKPKKQA